jgi:hypothetical protein
MKRIDLGDTVRMPNGDEGRVTGTMTLGPNEAGGAVKRSLCAITSSGPSWVPVEDVVLVAKAAKR